MYYYSNNTCVLGMLTILIHTKIRLDIQYNYRSILWNYIWILIERLRNQRPILVVPPDVSTSVKEIWIGNVLLL